LIILSYFSRKWKIAEFVPDSGAWHVVPSQLQQKDCLVPTALREIAEFSRYVSRVDKAAANCGHLLQSGNSLRCPMQRRQILIGGGALAVAGTVGGYFWSVRDGGYQRASAALRQGLGRNRSDDFANLVRHAVAAANGHNTQPWKFREAANQILIQPDFVRRTPVVDPDDHHLFSSLGCAAENLMVAARAAGRSTDYAFQPGQQDAISISFGTAVGEGDAALFGAIPKRQSTRSIYTGQPVQDAHLKLLASAASVPGCTMVLITEKPRMDAILDLVVAANDRQVRDPAFVAELSEWIRFNGTEAVRKGDGLYGASSGNPSLPGWLGPSMFKAVFTPENERQKCIDQIWSSAGFAIFVAAKNDPEHWALAGRSCQRFSLMATALGIKTAYLNQPVEVPDFRPRLAGLLDMPGLRPNLLLRFGYADPMPYSLRRPLSDVIVGRA
jgi:Nitroreductase family